MIDTDRRMPGDWKVVRWCRFTSCPYHHPGGDSYTSTAVCVGHNVTEADAQESDGDEPHGVEEICVFLVVEPVVAKRQGDYFNDVEIQYFAFMNLSLF